MKNNNLKEQGKMLFRTSLISTIVVFIVPIIDRLRGRKLNLIMLLVFVLMLASTIRDYNRYMK